MIITRQNTYCHKCTKLNLDLRKEYCKANKEGSIIVNIRSENSKDNVVQDANSINEDYVFTRNLLTAIYGQQSTSPFSN